MLPSADFAHHLKLAFDTESAVARFSEVRQFQALMRAFAGLPHRFLVEEYHGAKHQVFFNGQGPWGRTPARCELCDVVFVAYSPSPDFQVRVTFLQAKLSNDRHFSLCGNFPVANDAVNFKANLEQWDLLSRRPPILPVPPFKVHSLLLQGATLPSVGSFGVFHRTNGHGAGFFYASADHLAVVGIPTSKSGRLATDGVSLRQRTVSGYLETTFCCCLKTFGSALYNLEIGTPVELSVAMPGSPPSPLTLWLLDVLRAYVRNANPDSRLAGELLQNLGFADQVAPDNLMPLPALVLIRSEPQSDF